MVTSRAVFRPALAVVAVVLLAVLVIPLVWPVPPLEGTLPVRELADADSRFIEVDGVTIHYKEAGEVEAATTFVLLHGFGASTFSWRQQMDLLAARGRVIAFDRPAFGLTERPLPGDWDGDNPYSISSNSDQLIGLMDALDIDRAWLVGHSAGAAVAVLAAADHPERVEGMVLSAPAVYETRTLPSVLSALLRTPQLRRVGPLAVRRIAGEEGDSFIRSAYADPEFATPEVVAGYRKPLQAENWDRGLWELVAAPRTESISGLLGEVRAPTLVIHGDRDTFVDPANGRKVAEEIASAQEDASGEATVMETFVELEEVGHLPHEERPEAFATEVYRFLDAHGPDCGT